MKRYQSIPKIDEGFQTINQDAIGVQDKCVVLSDGAGGMGFFNEHWALRLCTSLCSCAPIKNLEDFEAWFEPLRTAFFEEQKPNITNPSRLPKYEKQGSLATLVAAWHDNNDLHLLSYGDSGLLVFDESGCLIFRNIKQLISFTESPYLLTTAQTPYPEAFLFETIPVKSGYFLVLASDAVTQWVLTQYLLRQANNDEIQAVLDSPYALGNFVETCQKNQSTTTFAHILEQMWTCLKTEDSFKECCYQKNNISEMATDDYSLLMWRF